MAVLVSDTFTEASDTELSAHTPDTGTGWTEEVNATPRTVDVRAATDDIATSGDFNNDPIIYTAQPDPSGTEYDVEIDIKAESSSADDAFGLVGRYTASNNYYGVQIVNQNGTDFELYKNVAGSLTQLATADVDPTTTYTVKFEILDATKKVYVDDVEKLSSTDDALTASGKGGIAWGDFVVSGKDINSGFVADNFVLTEVDADAAIEVPKTTLSLEVKTANIIQAHNIEVPAL